ncbi:ARP2/3 complex ARPC3, 21 kDa subunit (macronuclear) [Tetrahymena thermophila SB210]|uniref:Actin-related protein 2/3 complex subunit 3 n=1 Tax=Tetrahymena thermophila (strain SB210) TaxID=312017 RepID=I7LUJ4_TETTS|nr:ARP2/3 complex ARPC3, 21 kDa subunit [Tetrahymena thermophila SB210]EAR93892.2 ARP2/3 complex ARPC3, 21 kDa subunit [Tetrahymena thermophila SB210]|eukprot:XP_001014137.2 ARP2/3 complex ARPC3, 21 kDa subunit [Tetrahymena thermophila SB210]
MAEHSSFNAVNNVEVVCGMAIPPIKTKVQGPAATIPQQDVIDIIDEAIKFFRPNLLFKNYEIKGPGDVFIIYMTVFITQCLRKIANEEKEANALRMLIEMARLPVPKPNEAGFFMRGIAKDPTSNAEGEKFSAYLKQAKEELVNRLIKVLYKDGVKSWDHKFWVGLSKKNFMNLKF